MNHYFGHHTLEGEWHALLPRYMMLAERVEGARVLDIGCGTGLGSSLFLELGAKAVDAIDHRPGVLEIARMKHTKQGLDFHVMLWEELDFPEDTFDIIVCLDPSSPVTDPNLLREVRRVLKPGGQYICAIERSTVQGMETLLPRYGYAEMAERIEFNETAPGKVPQVGELSRHFERVYTLHQRPLYSFLFDLEPSDARATSLPEGDATKDNEELPEEESADPTPEPTKPAPSINTAFYDTSPEPAAVELWFCGEQELNAPEPMEVRLPYYRLIERLQHQVQTLQARQREQSEQSFDELLEEGTEAFEDSTRTLEIDRPFFEKEITQVKPRPLLPIPSANNVQIDQIDAHLNALQALYRRVQTDFERILFDTQAALDVRHVHIDNLLDASTRQLNQQIGQQHLNQHIAHLETQLRQVTEERNHLLAEREATFAVQQGIDEVMSQPSAAQEPVHTTAPHTTDAHTTDERVQTDDADARQEE